MSMAASTTWWGPVGALWQREVVRFLRQRGRVIGALGTPVVFWVFLQAGLGRSFHVPGLAEQVSYGEYFYAGTVVAILLFTAIFSTISVIEDRNEGFLQSVLVAPIGRSAIVMGKVMGCTTLAVGQAVLFLLLSPLAGATLTLSGVGCSLALLVLGGIGLSALGLLIAWRMNSMQGYHSVMNLFLLPMWMLSGSVFPLSAARSWLGWVMRLNPMTYVVAGLRQALYPKHGAEGIPSLGLSIAVTAGFAVLMVVLAGSAVSKD
jgi:ABC-2 type transport system permease protein